MEDACEDIAVDAFHGWIRHARLPRYLARNIACDVDEVLWPAFDVLICYDSYTAAELQNLMNEEGNSKNCWTVCIFTCVFALCKTP